MDLSLEEQQREKLRKIQLAEGTKRRIGRSNLITITIRNSE